MGVGNFDSLAALVLYWHKAKINGKGDQHPLAYAMFEILLIIGYEMDRRELLNEFFELFRVNIFENMDWGNESFTMTPEQYRNNVHLLSEIVSQINGRDFAYSLDDHKLKVNILTQNRWLNIKLTLGLNGNWYQRLVVQQQST